MNVMSPIDAKELPVKDVIDELWYKDAIIYQLHVKAFADSNNDGIGDFAGLTEKLDYLQELGVTTLWLLPFYPSPGRDDGYDIADYGAINPDFGTMKDFRRFIAGSQAARPARHHRTRHQPHLRPASTGSSAPAAAIRIRARATGMSGATPTRNIQGTRIIFTDTEKSNWTWDPEAGQFYWHRFFSHQPDLNFDNPRVVSALVQVMKRWLDTGVDGFRLDAIPYLCERDGTNNENLPETHAIIKQLRAELDAYAKGKVLLAEANQWPEDVQEYFGHGDECHMAYHFPLMPRIYMAIAQEDRFPITDILRQTPDIPANCQWALFLRNHDELTLEMVTDVERDYLWSTYANDPRARINVGIRRRLAPLMDNDRRKIELMNSLLLSFPGTPIIYYGDEIGMGDNIYLGDRNGVRTPMQWTPDRNGGFSRADPARLYAPTIMDPVYGYESVNVEAQSRSLSSLLSGHQAADRGAQIDAGLRPRHHDLHPPGKPLGAVLRAPVSRTRSSSASPICRDRRRRPNSICPPWKDRIPLEMLGRTRFPPIGELPYMITLAPYGFYWFELQERDKSEPVVADAPCRNSKRWWCRSARPGCRWRAPAACSSATCCRTYLARTPLVSGAIGARRSVRPLTSAVPFCDIGDNRPWLAFFEDDAARRHARATCCRCRSNGCASTASATTRAPWRPSGRARAKARCSTSPPTRSSSRCCCAICSESLTVDEQRQGVRLEFRPTGQLLRTSRSSRRYISARSRPNSPTRTALVDDDYVVKIYRTLEPGINPEIEIGRFLTDVAGFANTPALLGSVELVEGDETQRGRRRARLRRRIRAMPGP